MSTTLDMLRARITPSLCTDLAGMLALSVIVFGCLHLPSVF